jgi:hypothetical protein
MRQRSGTQTSMWQPHQEHTIGHSADHCCGAADCPVNNTLYTEDEFSGAWQGTKSVHEPCQLPSLRQLSTVCRRPCAAACCGATQPLHVGLLIKLRLDACIRIQVYTGAYTSQGQEAAAHALQPCWKQSGSRHAPISVARCILDTLWCLSTAIIRMCRLLA